MHGRRRSSALLLLPVLVVAVGCTPSEPRVAVLTDCTNPDKPATAPWGNTPIEQVQWYTIKKFVEEQACFDRSKGRIDKEVRDRDTWLRADIVPAAKLSELTLDELRAGRFVGYVNARNKEWKRFGVGRYESLVWVDGRGAESLRFVFVEARQNGSRRAIGLYYKTMTSSESVDADFKKPRRQSSPDSEGATQTMARMLVEDEAWFRCTSAGCCCTDPNCH